MRLTMDGGSCALDANADGMQQVHREMEQLAMAIKQEWHAMDQLWKQQLSAKLGRSCATSNACSRTTLTRPR